MMRTTKEQRDYIKLLEGVMPEEDIVVCLKDDDELLRWYLRRSKRGFSHTTQLINCVGKSMDFWLSVGDSHVDMEAVVMNYDVVMNQNTIAKYVDKLPFYVWSTISSQVGLSQWFIEKCECHIVWHRLHLGYTTLTEDFIRQHKDSLNWNDIALTQEMSDEFMEEFEDRLNVDLLFRNPQIPDQRINNLIVKHNGRFGKRK